MRKQKPEETAGGLSPISSEPPKEPNLVGGGLSPLEADPKATAKEGAHERKATKPSE